MDTVHVDVMMHQRQSFKLLLLRGTHHRNMRWDADSTAPVRCSLSITCLQPLRLRRCRTMRFAGDTSDAAAPAISSSSSSSSFANIHKRIIPPLTWTRTSYACFHPATSSLGRNSRCCRCIYGEHVKVKPKNYIHFNPWSLRSFLKVRSDQRPNWPRTEVP